MKLSMTGPSKVGLALILLSGGFSILWGFSIGQNAPAGMVDFKAVYYGARCQIEHRDPYNESEFLDVFRADGGKFPAAPETALLLRRAMPVCINLPTTLFLVTPFASLAWGPAHVLWTMLGAGCLLLAGFASLNLAGNASQGVSVFLICMVLANCEVIFSSGNIAGISVSLCVIAVWCFLKQRFVPAGVLCLAVSLLLKPHDAGLVWLYFLLAGAPYRKRALQTLLLTMVLGLPAILWVSNVSPHWMQELHSNLQATSAHGDIRDPGPNAVSIHTPDMVIDLQAAISIFKDDARFYDPATYIVCGALLLLWSVRTLRARFTPPRVWLALAAIVPLTMLITYHRPYDAKLLLLTVPACAMLWAEGGAMGRIGLLVNTAGIVLTGDIPLALLVRLSRKLHLGTAGIFGQILTVVMIRPASLILLTMAIFYLCLYIRRNSLTDTGGCLKEAQGGAGEVGRARDELAPTISADQRFSATHGVN